MAFFEEMGRKLSQTSQDVVQKTKDTTEISRINGMIIDEEKTISLMFDQMGKSYFDAHKDDEAPEFAALINKIKESRAKIEEHKENIKRIRGIMPCPHCGQEINYGVPFCSFCGKRVNEPVQETPAEPEVPANLCVNCGNVLAEGMLFCTSCGHKVGEPVAQPEPEVAPVVEPEVPQNLCVNCGHPLADGVLFCTSCGHKVGEPVAQPEPEVAPVVEPEVPVAPAEPEVKPENLCVNCGNPLSEGVFFCTSCGHKVGEPVAQPEPVAPVVPEPVAPVVEPEVPVAPVVPEPVAPKGNVCTGCGAVVPEGDLFCTACGTKVGAPAPVAPAPVVEPEVKKCVHCGRVLDPEDRFCVGCGTRVQ